LAREFEEFPQGQFTCPEDVQSYGVPERCAAAFGVGGKDIMMLDNALAMVDNFVNMKLN